jgi:radical SAM-linked protein
MLARALRRARWPLVYSEGFNPLPRFAIVLPRPVGTASECQLALVTLDRAIPHERLQTTLAAALPAGVAVTRIDPWLSKKSAQPREVTYAIELPNPPADLPTRVERLLATDELWIDRDDGPKKHGRRIDLRPYLETVAVERDELRVTLVYIDQRTARPYEILDALELASANLKHRIRLVDVQWHRPTSSGADASESPTKGTTRDQINQENHTQAHHQAP